MDEERRKKVLIMRISIITFIVLLFSIWAYNLKNVWLGGQRLASPAADDNSASWASLKADFRDVLNETKSQLAEIEKIKTAKERSDQNSFLNNLLGGVGELAAATSSGATSTVVSPLPSATTTPSAGTSSSTGEVIVKLNCPKYINCMPTIGRTPRPCKVPVGCENVTTIAY